MSMLARSVGVHGVQFSAQTLKYFGISVNFNEGPGEHEGCGVVSAVYVRVCA